MDINTYSIRTGVVQCYLHREQPFVCEHFGPAQYDSSKPIKTNYIDRNANPIVADLNSGRMGLEEAVRKLKQL